MNFWEWADKHWALFGFTVVAILVIAYDHFPTIRINWTRKP